jgi:hypothetical protein
VFEMSLSCDESLSLAFLGVLSTVAFGVGSHVVWWLVGDRLYRVDRSIYFSYFPFNHDPEKRDVDNRAFYSDVLSGKFSAMDDALLAHRIRRAHVLERLGTPVVSLLLMVVALGFLASLLSC